MTARTVIVTGGFGALGRAVAGAFAAHGDRVARIDVAKTAPDQSAALDLGDVDITNSVTAADVVARVTAILGAPVVLVNVAGGFVCETLDTGGPATWEQMFRMNLLTAASMTKAALSALKAAKAASIVNIGSVAGAKAAAGMGAYAASKGAVHRLTESLADELKGTGVTVNAILPTVIDTPRNRADMPEADFNEWVKPQAIAEVIIFPASPAARAISGALIPVSRGSEG